jgi:hypothetical protein
LKLLRYINVFAHYRSQVCDLTYFSMLQTACPQPLPGNELLKTCNVHVTQFFTVTYPSEPILMSVKNQYSSRLFLLLNVTFLYCLAKFHLKHIQKYVFLNLANECTFCEESFKVLNGLFRNLKILTGQKL